MKLKNIIIPILALFAIVSTVNAEQIDRHVLVVDKDDCVRGMAPGREEIEEVIEELHEVVGDMHDIQEDRPFMGILLEENGSGDDRGVRLLGVTPGGAAQKAGLQANDVILALNGKSMAKTADKAPNKLLVETLKQRSIGDEVEVIVDRDGQARTFRFALGSYRAGHDDIARVVKEYRFHGPMHEEREHHPKRRLFRGPGALGGLSLANINRGLGAYFGTDQGLLVLSVPAVENMSIKEGDVILAIGGREPNSPQKAWRIIDSYDVGEQIPLHIMRQQQPMDIMLVRP